MTTVYFPRFLRTTESDEITKIYSESSMLETPGPKIILGEPGMGKTHLVQEIGRRLDTEIVTAIRFISSKSPAKFVQPGKPLLIDGLDEAMARRDGDAVDAILAQLEEAGSPDFFLSCRAREWQSRTVTNLKKLYGSDPTIFTLEPFRREDAAAFLTANSPIVGVESVLSHLDAHLLADLYHNPLTLSLMGRVAEVDQALPQTRAALFDRVCRLIWMEQDPDRQDLSLGQLEEEEALAAAGATFAAMLLAGAEAVTIAGAVTAQDGDLRLATVGALPKATSVRAVYSSNLFQSNGVGRARPIHRVIAEFLGARWLARQASTPRIQRRLIRQFQGNGAVPASLRGLHAWLAFHGPALFDAVVNADPLGPLRYGETADMTPAQADCLITSLEALAEQDPFFRGSDWDSHTAAGLMVPALSDRIDDLIKSAEANEHLRSLLIEGMQATPLAETLSGTLENVMMSRCRFYRERNAAADALKPLRSDSWWIQRIIALNGQGTEDCTRLARNILSRLDISELPDQLIIETIFAEMGLTVSAFPRQSDNRRNTVRQYARLMEKIPSDRVLGMLTLVSQFASLLPGEHEWQNENEIVEMLATIAVRAIDEGLMDCAAIPILWQALGVIEDAHRFGREIKRTLIDRLAKNDTLRRTLQRYALNEGRGAESLWSMVFTMHHRMVGISLNREDTILLLADYLDKDRNDPAVREDWRDLMQAVPKDGGMDPAAIELARAFIGDDAELQAFLNGLGTPPDWLVKQERDQRARDRQFQKRVAAARKVFQEHEAELRAGDLKYTTNPGRAYLGLCDDLRNDLPPRERLKDWLGDGLADAAIVGFEATLHRSDMPDAACISNSFAKSKILFFVHPLLAGLLERLTDGRGFIDLPDDVCRGGLLLCYHDWAWDKETRIPDLKAALEARILTSEQERLSFARLMVEPALKRRVTHVPGLYQLASDSKWHAAGVAIASDWLKRNPAVSAEVEANLIGILVKAGALDRLREASLYRAAHTFRNVDHLMTWLAIDVWLRFDDVRDQLGGIGENDPAFALYVMNRLRGESGPALPQMPTATRLWIVSEFRPHWPYVSMFGQNSNSEEASVTDFLRGLINGIANEGSLEASAALQTLIEQPEDLYTKELRHLAAEQRQKRAEEEFTPLSPTTLGSLLLDQAPSNIDDLKAVVLEELAVAQAKLLGEDLDQVRDFWSDAGVPRDENRCRDRLAAIIGPELTTCGVQRITEADMPQTKRADLAFASGQFQLPMEIKGQWHEEVWSAATGQLDVQYLIDWRSNQRGIYCVLWFGDVPSSTGRRLKPRPDGQPNPTTPDEMKQMLIAGIPPARRPLIDVLVIDLRTGFKPQAKKSTAAKP